MRKPIISMNENEDADQLRGNPATFRSASFHELGMIDPIIRSA